MVDSDPDYLDIYQEYVPGLRKGSGHNFMGFCPIHGEEPGKSKPSLSVNIENGLWNCFAGCGGGNLKQFLEQVGEKRSTIDRVAKKFKSKPRKRSKKRRSEPATELPERLLGLFDWCPTQLLREGFDEKVLLDNDVGYDKKYSRITFPIRNKKGRLVGIVGRRPTGEPGGKYKVYTTELSGYGLDVPSFSKGQHLWRIDKVAQELRRTRKPVYIVEGFKAALWFCQSGLTNVVALMGSHMTDAQQHLIESLGPVAIACLDNDDAGRKGTLKLSQKLQATRLYVVPLPDGVHQPDDLTEEELCELCGTPVNISEAKRQWQERSL